MLSRGRGFTVFPPGRRRISAEKFWWKRQAPKKISKIVKVRGSRVTRGRVCPGGPAQFGRIAPAEDGHHKRTMPSASRELEQLVQRIQKQLAPKAEVLHDVKMPGRHSGRQRQIDVLVREKVGQYEINIIVDCKDYNKPIDVKGVEEFAGLLDDVGAQKGVLVCPRGFTKSAKERATAYQIDLYSPVDTDPHKWQVSSSIPALCVFRSSAISFGLAGSHPAPMRMSYEFYRDLVAYDEAGNALGTPLEVMAQRWNDGEIEWPDGRTDEFNIFGDTVTLVDNGYGLRVPVQLTATMLITSDLYFGQLPVPKISGFKDELRGHVITNAFAVGILDPDEIERDWLKIEHRKDAPVKPVLELRGVVCWIV